MNDDENFIRIYKTKKTQIIPNTFSGVPANSKANVFCTAITETNYKPIHASVIPSDYIDNGIIFHCAGVSIRTNDIYIGSVFLYNFSNQLVIPSINVLSLWYKAS